MPLVDAWAVLADPDTPREVSHRLLVRQGARRNGRNPDPVPEEDKPILARHLRHACAAHDEIVRDYGQGWQHLSDHAACPPPEEEIHYV